MYEAGAERTDMDVTCERCGTEYEFDETLVSDRGTTVKCTSCGHLFKVFRPGSGPSGQDRNWSIQKRDGTKLVIGSLRELQKLITQGELTEQDEISRSGEGWKPLGSIAELQTFFAAARAVKQSAPPPRRDGTLPFETGPAAAPTPFGAAPSVRPPSARPPAPPAPSRGSQSGPLPQPPPAGPPPRSPKGTIMGVGARGQQQLTPPAARSAKGTIMGVGSTPPAAAATTPDVSIPKTPSAPSYDERASRENGAAATADARPRAIAPTREARHAPPSRPPQPPRGLPTEPGPGTEHTPRPAGGRGPSARPAVRAPSDRPARPSDRAPARPLYMDEADHDLRPAKKSRAGLWIALVVLLIAGVGIGVGWNRIAPALGIGEQRDPLAAFLERGSEQIAEDHPEAYERAIRELIRGTAIRERDPRLLASLSRAHGLLAQSLAFQASDLEARAAADPALAGEAAALRRDQRQNAEEARRLGEDAVRQSPNDIVAVLALADALRMTGDPSGARSHLERAATLERDPSAEQLRVAALLDVANAGEDISAAREKAARAVEVDPAVIRSRLLYARALLAGGDVAQARGQIDAVLNDHPDHPDARRLHDAVEQGLPPAAPVVAVLDAGPGIDAGAPSAATTEVAVAPGTASAGGGGGGGGGSAVPAGRDYDWYVGRGEQAQNVGDVGRARQFFDAALAQRPNGPEALTGIGYLLRDQRNFAGALPKFQSASGAGYAPALIGLGLTQRDLGRKEDAIQSFQRYVDRGGGSERSIALRQIEELRRELGSSAGSGTGTGGASGAETGSDTGGGSGTGTEGGTGGTEGGTGGTEGGTGGSEPAPPTPPDTLPPPRGTDPDNPPPSSDPPAIGTE